MPTLQTHALAHLRTALANPAADFREGQWPAIAALVEQRARLLVVQRTGWGKSVVYFLATRLLRDQGSGPTLLVSPLLALMRNQIDAAVRLGVRAATVNSSNRDDWNGIKQQLLADEIDVLIISPERLSNDEFLDGMLLPVAGRIGLFVVDEAHCISDWGHDFRPDYRRITRILQRLPANVPVCATTATANDRVVADVASQLGQGIQIIRGALVRESLRLQTVPLSDDAAKLGWLAEYVPKFAGSGIIYALTQRWTELIADWLNLRGIGAACYHSGLSDDERRTREDDLLGNRVKVLVATTALGMGYDKPDLGFVVHFHQPGSVVAYYQQVGRAGRAIDKAYGVMLSGGDDEAINDFFIDSAFPTEAEVGTILQALDASTNGLTVRDLESQANLAKGRIENTLKALSVDANAPVSFLDKRWVTTANRYDPVARAAFVAHHTQIRRAERVQMDDYLRHSGCLMEFLARVLNDPNAGRCGRCAPCQGKPEVMRQISDSLVEAARQFLRTRDRPLETPKQWPGNAMPQFGWNGGNIPKRLQAVEGRSLCLVGDSGWWPLVRDGKYQAGRFSDDLLEAMLALLRRWQPEVAPSWVTCIPSLARPTLVPDFARRLAQRLNLPFVPAVIKTRQTPPQKDMANRWHQANNLDGAFRVQSCPQLSEPVLLIDDVVDSGWTFALISALLRQAGSGPVIPLALASNR